MERLGLLGPLAITHRAHVPHEKEKNQITPPSTGGDSGEGVKRRSRHYPHPALSPQGRGNNSPLLTEEGMAGP